MQITEHIHALKIPFTLEIGPGKTLERFVYAYLIYGSQICLIDCGVASSKDRIFDYIRETGRDPEAIRLAVLTHAHPDHIGGALAIQEAVGCQIAAHADSVPWIEDVALQFQQRPVPGFYSLVGGSVRVDRVLNDGDTLDLGAGQALSVIETSGHSSGHIALFYEADGALFSGDGIPMPGAIPVYDDVRASIKSLQRLKAIKNIEVLLSSWDEPRRGAEVKQVLNRGMDVLQGLHERVLKAHAAAPSADIPELAAQIVQELGLPPMVLNPILFKSIGAHLQWADQSNLFDL